MHSCSGTAVTTRSSTRAAEGPAPAGGERDKTTSIPRSRDLGETGPEQHLHGDAGDDTSNGGSGAETLDPGTGNDKIDGGGGADDYIGLNSGSVVHITSMNTDGAGILDFTGRPEVITFYLKGGKIMAGWGAQSGTRRGRFTGVQTYDAHDRRRPHRLGRNGQGRQRRRHVFKSIRQGRQRTFTRSSTARAAATRTTSE